MKAAKEKLPPSSRKKYFLIWTGIILGGIALYFLGEWLVFRWRYVSTDDAQVKGNLINLSAKVPGRIRKLLVDEGDRLQAGQVLIELDPKDFMAALAQAQANLEMVRHDLAKAITQLALTKKRIYQGIEIAEVALREAQENLKLAEEDAALQTERVEKEIIRARANLQAARARVVEAQATWENSRKEFERLAELFRQNYVAENARDAAETAWQVAESRYKLALENEKEALAQLELAEANRRSVELKRQNIRLAEQALQKAKINLELAYAEKKQISLQEKQIELLQAKEKEAKAAGQLAEINLKETKVISPISGTVSKRFVDQGQIIQPGQPLLVVNDPQEKWVVANVEETKIRRVHPGAKVKVEVDAFPGREFSGRVDFVGSAALSEFSLLPADNPSGNFVKITHRLPVRITVQDPENLLKPGMMVVVAIEAK